MVTKADLHALVDALPDDLADEAARRLTELHDPVLRSVFTAPHDDEPETAEERASVAEARAELARGEALTTAQLRQSLGL